MDLRDLTDARLLELSGNDADAFRVVYDRHAARVLSFFRSRTGNVDDALDLTAETFAQAWLSRDRFADRRNGSIAPWLFGIAANVLRHSVRRSVIESRARADLRLSGAVRTDAPASDEWLDGIDDDLQDAMAELPADQRHAVTLRVVDDHPYEAVARMADCSPTAARIRVFRGLGRLRTALEGRDP
jgi:RNA polymerase sigma factor (sigma-70 family)